MNDLEREIIWCRSCFKGYDVDEEGLEKIAKKIIEFKERLNPQYVTVYGYTLRELKQIIDYARQNNFKVKKGLIPN
jgi:hypothetical protein